jgi:pyruvate/2-oxoglutarate dehydrogenase complex dihydrolipoamide dehydrogenase (E3) component
MYDVVVIGSGSGGLAAAKYAAGMGAKVALIERAAEKLGGVSLHVNDIPTKALVHASREYGSWYDVKRHIEKSRNKLALSKDYETSLQRVGIDLYFGDATFTSPKTVKVGKETVAARRVVIASGATPHIPNVPGLKQAGFLTVAGLASLSRLPQSVAIIGGGMVAVELAFALRRLGCEVTIVEHSSHILGHLDAEVSEYVKDVLQSSGAKVHTSTSIQGVARSSRGHKIEARHLGDPLAIRSSNLLIATGRDPVLPGGLSKAEVNTTKLGIPVNSQWQTNNKSIYAIGDVVEEATCLTPHAAVAAKHAVKHALLGQKSRQSVQPQVIFSEPELAHTGATAAQLLRQGIDHQVYTLELSDTDYGKVVSSEGFIRIICGPGGRVIGGTIVGDGAGELIGYLALAINKKWTLSNIGDLPLAYPTLSAGFSQIAEEAEGRNMPVGAKEILTLRRLAHL